MTDNFISKIATMRTVPSLVLRLIFVNGTLQTERVRTGNFGVLGCLRA